MKFFKKTSSNLRWNLSLVKMVWPLHTSEQISPPPQNNVHLFDGLIWSNNLSVIYRSSCTEFVVNFEIINNFPKLAQYIMRLPKRVLRRDTPTRIPMAVLNCLWLVMEQIPDYFSEFRANFIKISRFSKEISYFLYFSNYLITPHPNQAVGSIQWTNIPACRKIVTS